MYRVVIDDKSIPIINIDVKLRESTAGNATVISNVDVGQVGSIAKVYRQQSLLISGYVVKKSFENGYWKYQIMDKTRQLLKYMQVSYVDESISTILSDIATRTGVDILTDSITYPISRDWTDFSTWELGTGTTLNEDNKLVLSSSDAYVDFSPDPFLEWKKVTVDANDSVNLTIKDPDDNSILLGPVSGSHIELDISSITQPSIRIYLDGTATVNEVSVLYSASGITYDANDTALKTLNDVVSSTNKHWRWKYDYSAIEVGAISDFDSDPLNTIILESKDEIDQQNYANKIVLFYNGGSVTVKDDSAIAQYGEITKTFTNKNISDANTAKQYAQKLLSESLSQIRKKVVIANPQTRLTMDYITGYKRKITITNGVSNDVSDIAVKIELDSSNFDFIRTDGSDVYFLDSSDNPLYYWIESWDNDSEEATIWVKIPSIVASGSVDIYMYYGSGSNPYSSYNDRSQIPLVVYDFENLSTGTLAGQDNWTGSSGFDVISPGLNGSDKAVQKSYSGSPMYAIRDGDRQFEDVDVMATFKMPDYGTDEANGISIRYNSGNYVIIDAYWSQGNSKVELQVRDRTGGTTYYICSVGSTSTTTTNTEYKIFASLRGTDIHVEFRDINDNVLGSNDCTLVSTPAAGNVGLGTGISYASGIIDDIIAANYGSFSTTYSIGSEEEVHYTEVADLRVLIPLCKIKINETSYYILEIEYKYNRDGELITAVAGIPRTDLIDQVHEIPRVAKWTVT